MTTARLIIAVVSTLVEEFALYAIWRWALPELDIYVPMWVLVAVMIAWAVFAIISFIFVGGHCTDFPPGLGHIDQICSGQPPPWVERPLTAKFAVKADAR